MKVQFKRAFRSYFLSPKSQKKDNCLQVPLFPISKVTSHFLLVLFVKRMSQSWIHDQLNGKQTYSWLPPSNPANIGPHPESPLKILFDHPGDVPIWRPKDILIWCPGEVPNQPPWKVHWKTFSGRLLGDFQRSSFRYDVGSSIRCP